MEFDTLIFELFIILAIISAKSLDFMVYDLNLPFYLPLINAGMILVHFGLLIKDKYYSNKQNNRKRILYFFVKIYMYSLSFYLCCYLIFGFNVFRYFFYFVFGI